MARTSKPLRTITADELVRLIAEMPERYRALVEVMAYQGLRPGEAVSLRVGDSIRCAGRSPSSDALRVHQDRASPDVDPAGADRGDAGRAHCGVLGPDNVDAPMFTTESGDPIATKNAYDAWRRRHFASARARAGIDRKLSPNDLRHYAVKFAIGQGADVFAVQKMLGHAKPSITLDVYGSEWETSAEELAAPTGRAHPAGSSRATHGCQGGAPLVSTGFCAGGDQDRRYT